MGLSLAKRFSLLPRATREAWIDQQEPWVIEEIARGAWWWLARPEQRPPTDLDWLVYLALAGRGWGKSRSGGEWLVDRTQDHPADAHGAPTEHLIVAETLADARSICMEGPAGVLRALDRREIKYRYKQVPKPMVLFPNGCKIYCEGADDADVGRGYTLASAWLDEVAKWPNAYGSWYEGILPALRADLGDDHPRAFATTTPKDNKLLKKWLEDAESDDPETRESIIIVSGSTFDNSDNLSRHGLRVLQAKYEGTAIGEQELHGRMLEALEGALFKRSDLNASRVERAPDDLRIVIGVDPSMMAEGDTEPIQSTRSRRGRRIDDSYDEMGVIVVGTDTDSYDHYVLADVSRKLSGREAALHVWRVLLEWGASYVVCEENVGKKWLRDVFHDAWRELVEKGEAPSDTSAPLRTVDAKLGKKTRAEPVAMRAQQQRLHMVGTHPALEDQLCTFSSWDGKESPDRLDALVHACRDLMKSEYQEMRVIDPDDHARNRRFDDGLGQGFGWAS